MTQSIFYSDMVKQYDSEEALEVLKNDAFKTDLARERNLLAKDNRYTLKLSNIGSSTFPEINSFSSQLFGR